MMWSSGPHSSAACSHEQVAALLNLHKARERELQAELDCLKQVRLLGCLLAPHAGVIPHTCGTYPFLPRSTLHMPPWGLRVQAEDPPRRQHPWPRASK